MKTRAQALHEVAVMVAEQGAILDTLTPEEIAARAWRRGGPSTEELIANATERQRRRGLLPDPTD